MAYLGAAAAMAAAAARGGGVKYDAQRLAWRR